MSPHLAAALLQMFNRQAISLTEARFEEAFDTLVRLLEDSNNERYRLRDQQKDRDP